jgi:hypothetical protein
MLIAFRLAVWSAIYHHLRAQRPLRTLKYVIRRIKLADKSSSESSKERSYESENLLIFVRLYTLKDFSNRCYKMYKFFPSDFFNFEFVRVLGAAPFYGAETGECLNEREHIKDCDPESWYLAWITEAEKSVFLAEEALRNGDRMAASWAYIRVSNYYRSSSFSSTATRTIIDFSLRSRKAPICSRRELDY